MSKLNEAINGGTLHCLTARGTELVGVGIFCKIQLTGGGGLIYAIM